VKLGWRTAKSDLALSTSYAYNTLGANGLQDFRLLAANYTAATPSLTSPATGHRRSI